MWERNNKSRSRSNSFNKNKNNGADVNNSFWRE